MVTKSERDRKNSGQLFRDLMDSAQTHLRVGQGHDNTRVTLVMTAAQAHSLDGVCTCCPRRPAGEPSAREVAAAAARAVARRRAELGPIRPVAFGDDPPLLVDQLRADAIAQAREAAQRAPELGRRD